MSNEQAQGSPQKHSSGPTTGGVSTRSSLVSTSVLTFGDPMQVHYLICQMAMSLTSICQLRPADPSMRPTTDNAFVSGGGPVWWSADTFRQALEAQAVCLYDLGMAFLNGDLQVDLGSDTSRLWSDALEAYQSWIAEYMRRAEEFGISLIPPPAERDWYRLINYFAL
jgi:NAD-dependent oxidoreductase involved in siderophore biosynthesis